MDEAEGHGKAETLRETALRGIEQTQFYPAWGKARLHGMIANRPDWCSRASASGACRCRSSCTRRPASCIRARWSCSSRSRSSVEKGGIEAWQRVDARESCSAPRRAALRQEQATSSTSGSTRAPRTSPCCAARTRHESRRPGRPVPRRLRPAPRLVPLVAADRLRDGRPRAVQRRCSRTASSSTARAARCRKSLGNVHRAAGGHRARSAPRSCACGSPRPTTRGELAISDEILEARGRERTAASATRCASCSPTLATSTRRSDAVPLGRDGRDRPLRARA